MGPRAQVATLAPDRDASVELIAISADGHGALVLEHGEVELWDFAQRRRVAELGTFAHGAYRFADVTGIGFSPDQRLVAMVTADRMLRVWQVEDGRKLAEVPTPNKPSGVVFAPDGQTLALGGIPGPRATRPPERPRRRPAGPVESLRRQPMELMARLAALIPPPRIPLVRYHGVFASRSSWRPLVTPKPPPGAKPKPKPCAAAPSASASAPPEAPSASASSASPSGAPSWPSLACDAPPAKPPGPEAPLHGFIAAVLGRAVSPYIDWRTLLQRVFDLDALACSTCGGRLRFLSVLTEQAGITRLLQHLGLPADRPRLQPARAPPLFEPDILPAYE